MALGGASPAPLILLALSEAEGSGVEGSEAGAGGSEDPPNATKGERREEAASASCGRTGTQGSRKMLA